jgi:hypothetical protein
LGRACSFRRVVAVVDPGALFGYAAVSFTDKQVKLNEAVARSQLLQEKQQFYDRLSQRNQRRDENRERRSEVLGKKAEQPREGLLISRLEKSLRRTVFATLFIKDILTST